MHDDRPPPDGDDPIEPLDSREAERVRRRDHDLDAGRRELMRPGMGKVFKQITDSWSRKAARPRKHPPRTTGDD